jgi:hypothetical protein
MNPQIHKYYIIVVLLTGVIPDRAMFRKPVLKQALIPYFQIVQGMSSSRDIEHGSLMSSCPGWRRDRVPKCLHHLRADLPR